MPVVSSAMGVQENFVSIPARGVALEASLNVPPDAAGVVLFAHGSGSSRRSPRNRAVARWLHEGRMATCLMDLLSEAEEQDEARVDSLRQDIDLMAERVTAAIDWLKDQPQTQGLRIGLFGSNSGGGAVLKAAVARAQHVGAIVLRSGRPDLGGEAVDQVRSPVLLIVGASDPSAITVNSRAMEQMCCEREMEIILGATHLFPEPGALDEAGRLARRWFERHLL